MTNYFPGKAIIRVTVNGCGIPLEGAKIKIGAKTYTIKINSAGFSEPITVFASNEKGEKRKISVTASAEGFCSLHNDVPVTSGYLTIWNMPLKAKVKEGQKS